MRDVLGRCIVSLALLLAPLALAFGPPHLAWRTGNLHLAEAALREALAAAPDDVELHAGLGATLSLLGEHADALPCFSFAPGAELYESGVWARHADTLRALGRGREAAALRLERLPAVEGERAALDLLLGAVEDLRAAGDAEGARALSELNLALHPFAELALAQRLELELDADGPELDALLALLTRRGPSSVAGHLALARLRAHDGDPQGGLALLAALPPQVQGQVGVVEALARLHLAAGEPAGALFAMERPLVRNPLHARLLPHRARALLALGRDAEAREACALAASRYPLDPQVQALAGTCPGIAQK